MGRNRDFDDDDFNFDDDFSFDDDNGDQLRGGVGGDEDDLGDFTFDDDLGTTDDFEDIELGDEGGDFTFDEDEELVAEEDAGGRSNRTFILLAGVMIVLFLAGLVAVIILATRESPADVSATQTSAFVIAFNATQQRFFEETQTAVAIFATNEAATINANATNVAATATADAAPPVATFTTSAELLAGPDPSFPSLGTISAGTEAQILAINPAGTFYRVVIPATGQEGWVSAAAVTTTGNLGRLPVEDVPTPEVFATPTLDETQVAGTLIAQAGTPVVTQEVTPGAVTPSSIEAVQQTATALAALFAATPTIEIGTPGGGGVVQPTALPDTGLIDDIIAGGNAGFLTLLLISIGLVGLIVASRWLRAANR
jgi:uncharacterized protein YraI